MRIVGRIARRLLAAAVLILAVVTFDFVLFRLAPGDPAVQLGRVPNGSVELQEQLTREFGLDKPLVSQYFHYLNQLIRGNMGISYVNQRPVSDNLLEAIRNTLPMVLLGVTFAIVLGVALGLYAGSRRGGVVDHGSVGIATILYSLPAQWIGLILLFLFSGWLPAGGMSNEFLIDPSFGTHLLDLARHIVLPALTLGLVVFGQYMLITRSSVVETLSDEYVLTARAKGLAPGYIMRRHVLRNALLPTITLIGLSLGALVGGAILVEVVFSWPGIGRTIYASIEARDYPMMQGAFLIFTVSVVMFNLLADAMYGVLDPRVRRPAEAP